jgi:hypothetical protein
MSVKLYSFLEQKTEKWQDEYRFLAVVDPYLNTFLTEALSLTKMKSHNKKVIGAIQDITKQRRRVKT